jgi:hypothetical protein
VRSQRGLTARRHRTCVAAVAIASRPWPHSLPVAQPDTRAKSMKPRWTSVWTSSTRARSPPSSPWKPRTTFPSATGRKMRTHVPLSDAPVTIACRRGRGQRGCGASDDPSRRRSLNRARHHVRPWAGPALVIRQNLVSAQKHLRNPWISVRPVTRPNCTASGSVRWSAHDPEAMMGRISYIRKGPDSRAEIVTGSEPTDQPLACQKEFGRRTVETRHLVAS